MQDLLLSLKLSGVQFSLFQTRGISVGHYWPCCYSSVDVPSVIPYKGFAPHPTLSVLAPLLGAWSVHLWEIFSAVKTHLFEGSSELTPTPIFWRVSKFQVSIKFLSANIGTVAEMRMWPVWLFKHCKALLNMPGIVHCFHRHCQL